MGNIDKENKIEALVENQYEEAKKEIYYPKGVVDQEAYIQYISLSASWKNHEYRFYKCKFKKELVLDLASTPSQIEQQINENKVPKNEQLIIQKINIELYAIIQKCIIQKKKAFGEQSVALKDGTFIADNLIAISPLIIELAGRFYAPPEIHQILCQDMEIVDVSIEKIKSVIKDNITKIKELKEKFKESYSDVRLSYKRARLDELNYIYNLRKGIYNKTRTREDEKQLILLLDNIKKEVQGDITVNLSIQVEDQANILIQNEISKELNISMFVISRIAGRMNINPLLLLSRLAHSRYSQFSGFGERGLSSTYLTDPISYPSAIVYNWGTIAELNEINEKEDKKIAELPILASSEKILSLKEQLLSKLKIAKEPMNKSKEEIKDALIN